MGTTVSPVNSSSQTTDGLMVAANTSQVLKRAVASSNSTPSGSDTAAAAQEVGTNVDDAAFGVATGTVMVMAGLADETSPDSVNEGDAGAIRMTLARNLHVVNLADAAALANVSSSATNVTLQAANANRIGLLIFNDSTQVLYVKYGATASSSSYSVKIAAGGYWEMPAPIYRGIVDGIWASANGNARMTELT